MPSTTDTATTIDSLDNPSATVTSVFMGFPFLSHRPLPRSRASCCSPQVPCTAGASDQFSDVEVPHCLHVPPPPRPFAHAAAASPANSSDALLCPHLTIHPALVSCHSDDVLIPLPRMSRLHFLCLPSTCLAGWLQRPMPSWVELMSICCFFVFSVRKYIDIEYTWMGISRQWEAAGEQEEGHRRNHKILKRSLFRLNGYESEGKPFKTPPKRQELVVIAQILVYNLPYDFYTCPRASSA
jgi:hypothetical protein